MMTVMRWCSVEPSGDQLCHYKYMTGLCTLSYNDYGSVVLKHLCRNDT